MERLRRAAVLVSLIKAMKENKSWCGDTHIQKACYFLQELLKVRLEFRFTLYKYGPYSFDLNDELSALRADDFLHLYVRDPQYGPCYSPGEMSGRLKQSFPKTIGRCRGRVDFIAEQLGDKRVSELERLATALYVRTTESDELDVDKAAERIVHYKRHISMRSAIDAVKRVDEMRKEVASQSM